MKRYIHSMQSDDTFYILKVVIELGYQSVPNQAALAASEDYIKRKQLAKEYQLTSDQIDELNHLIHRTIGTIIQHDFEIIKKYQSSESYTYYIRFIPTDYAKRPLKFPVQVQFEIRDHLVSSHPTEGRLGKRITVRAFYVGDKECFTTEGTFVEIRNICDDLKRGDYSSLIQGTSI